MLTKEVQDALWEKIRGPWARELAGCNRATLEGMLDNRAEELLYGIELCREMNERGIPVPKVIWERKLRTLHCPSAFELVLPRWVNDGTDEGSIEVWVLPRGPDDKSWDEDTEHTPGTYFQPGQGDEETAIRLLKKELEPATLLRWQQVYSTNLRSDLKVRASTRSVVYCGWMQGTPAKGRWVKWLDIMTGKVKIIGSHKRIITIGIGPFLADKPEFKNAS